MNYSTQQLTASLQRIARVERDVNPESDKATSPPTFCTNQVKIPSGADSFLEERREFQEKTRTVSIGNY
jgi:hypothetical protein